jgi:hypothetical protein
MQRPGHFAPQEQPGTHLRKGRIGPRSGLVAVGEEEVPYTQPELNPVPSNM